MRRSIGTFAAPWSHHEDHTEFKAYYTDQYFVFRFNVKDSSIIDVGDTEESVTAGDRVELFFANSPALAEAYYCIEISPGGRVLDYRAKYHRQFDNTWKMEGLQVAAIRCGTGYQVEGKIDLAFFKWLMGTKKMKGRRVYVGAFRADISAQSLPQDFIWFSWIRPKAASPDFHIPSSFGIFQF